MPHRLRSYVTAEQTQPRAKHLLRTERLTSDEIARRAHAFSVALALRGWSNEMGARKLGVSEQYVRYLRLGERPLSIERLRMLGDLGLEVIAELGLETPT